MLECTLLRLAHRAKNAPVSGAIAAANRGATAAANHGARALYL
jgi:hypothetical protein